MSAVAVSVEFDPLRDKSYRRAALGPDVAAFLTWFELGGARPISVDNYERALAVFCRMYPKTPVEEITDTQLLQVAKRFPVAGRRVRMAPYKTFLKWARQTRRIEQNPAELLPDFKRPHRKPHDTFSDAEIEQILSLDVVDAAPAALLLEAGLRRAEAIRLQVRHCAPETVKVRVIDGKGGKDRVVPQSARLQTLLADLILLEGLGPKDHLFYGTRANGQGHKQRLRATPIGEGTFARWWRRVLDEAGVRYRRPHECRHTFATRWRRRGLSADDLAILLGHESPETTSNLYVHITPEEVAERMLLLEERT